MSRSAKCVDCKQDAVEGRKRCEAHLEYRNVAAKRYQNSERGRIKTDEYERGERRRLIRRERLLRTAYNMTLDEYEAMLAAQGGKCAICETSENYWKAGQTGSMSVDHDHVSGEVRGLLCNNCNRAIGLFKDDPVVLDKAAKYLRKGVSLG